MPDKWTTINEHGLFVTCAACAESWVIIDRQSTDVEAFNFTGDECRELRLRKHLTQRELAIRAGVSVITIVRFENRPQHPLRGVILRRIAGALKVGA